MRRTVFNEDHEAFRQVLRDFIEAEVAPHYQEWYDAGIVPRDFYYKLAELGLTARSEIMRDAFRARARTRLSSRTVLLVDDVLTTGATCGAAARALKQAGAAHVVVSVIARTERTNL